MRDNLDIIEAVGVVKWYDTEKGFGFIVSNNGLGDILIHSTALHSFGRSMAHEGAIITVQAIRRPRGLQAFKIISIDDTSAINAVAPIRQKVVVSAESEWHRAIVKWFNRVRGFGFLNAGAEADDIFVHMDTLRRHGFNELRPGQIVQVRWGKNGNKLMVAEIRPDGIDIKADPQGQPAAANSAAPASLPPQPASASH
jgi:CspA family cold shock protein